MTNQIKAVFLPGKLCDQRLWLNSMHALADIIEPLFVDLRSPQNLAEMLEDIFNCCEGKFILIGFSMGGYIAQEFALKFPARVLGLALIGASADAYSAEEISHQQKFVDNVKQAGFKGLSETALRKFIHPNRYNDIILIDLIKTMAKDSGADAFITQHLATMNRRSRLEDLNNLDCPSIVIASRDDMVVSLSSLEAMATKIADAEFHIIDDCGHMIPLEQPTRLNELLRAFCEKLLP